MTREQALLGAIAMGMIVPDSLKDNPTIKELVDLGLIYPGDTSYKAHKITAIGSTVAILWNQEPATLLPELIKRAKAIQKTIDEAL